MTGGPRMPAAAGWLGWLGTIPFVATAAAGTLRLKGSSAAPNKGRLHSVFRRTTYRAGRFAGSWRLKMQLTFKNGDSLRGAKTLENVQVEISEIGIPALAQVHDYWDKVRGDAFAPSLRQFKLYELAPETVPYVTIVDFEGPPFDYRFRFFGTGIVELAGMELTGKRYNADRIEGFGYAGAQVFPTMIDTRCPIASRTRWLSLKSLEYVSTILRLPLSDDGATVTHGVAVYHTE